MDSYLIKSHCLCEAPVLTIAIPTYKRRDLLQCALKSALSQSFDFCVEIIVVDNDCEGLSGATVFCNEFGSDGFSYYVNKENYGMFGNWNQCVRLAKGEYVTILHDDDYLLPNFSRLVNDIYSGGGFGSSAFGFRARVLDLRGSGDRVALSSFHLAMIKIKKATNSLYGMKRIFKLKDLIFHNPFYGTLAVVFQRDKALAVGGFESKWAAIADYHFWLKWCKEYSEITLYNYEAAVYRVMVNQSMSVDCNKLFIETISPMLRGFLPSVERFIFADFVLKKKLDVDMYSSGLNWLNDVNFRPKISSTILFYFNKIALGFCRFINLLT